MADFANDSIEGLEELKKSLSKYKDELEAIVKLSAERAKQIDITKANAKEMTELAKATKQVAIAEKEIEKVNEQQAKTEIQLQKVKQQSLKNEQESFKLTVAQRKEKERLEKQAKKERENAEKLNSEYAKQSKRLNDLRKKYKNMRLEAGKSTKETEELRKEIQDLDKTLKDVDAEVGQFQRNVGNYPKVTGEAKAGFQTLFGFISGVFIGGLTKSRKATREFQLVLEKATSGIRIVAFELLNLFNNQILPFFDNLALRFEEASLQWEEFTNGFSDTPKIQKRLKEIEMQMAENTKTQDEYSFSLDKLLEIYEKTTKNIDDNNDAVDRAIDKNAILRDQIEELQITEQVLEANIGNSNFTFKEREAQIEALIKVQDEIIKKEKEIAQAEFDIAENLIVNNLLEQQAIEQDDERIRQRIRSLDFLKDKNLADAVQIENLEKLTAANTKLNEIEAQSQLQDVNALKERLDNRRDEFEQYLDFTLDISDRQKSVNERIIASDQQTVEEKFKTLAETEGLLDRSYQEQLRLTDEFIRDSAELRKKELDPEQQKELEEALKNFDLDRIVNLKDEEQIRKELIKVGIADEKVNQRIREIIIERKAALQDVADLQEEVIAQAREQQMTQEDAEFALSESRREIARQNKEFVTQDRIEDFEEEEEFNQKKLDSAKKALEEEKQAELELFLLQKSFELERAETEEDRLRIEEEIRQGELEIARKYYQALEDLDDTATEKRLAQAEKELEEKAEIFQKLTSALQEELSIQNAEDIRRAEERVSQAEESLAVQQRLAEQGLDNQLAFEKQRLDEANRQKLEAEQEAAEKEELLRIATILGESYIARLKQGEKPDQALSGATADAFIYREIARSIVQGAFIEGTENVAESLGAPLFSGEDGYVVAVDGRERIMNPEQNAKVRGISNDELADLGYKYKMGIPIDKDKSVFVSDNSSVIASIDRLENTIKNRPIQKVDIDKLGNIIEIIDNGNFKKVTKLKTRPRL